MTEQSLFPYITKPGRYLGSEYNATIKKNDDCSVSFCMIFPDLYEIGMSHQGLQILYHLVNQKRSFVAERCFSPDIDVEKLMQKKGQSICSLETGTPLKNFDLLAITLPYELCYTNILSILELAGIPLYNSQRSEDHPIILGGGSCAMNPEPVADFFDAILLGDGEEAVLEIGEAIEKGKEKKETKQQILTRFEQIEGVYLPTNYTPSYRDDGKIESITPKDGKAKTITRRVVSDLNKIDHLLHPIVPNAKIVHDRLGVEIARGCTRGCRFCQAGITYRPVRERTPEQIMKLAKSGIDDSGFDELALLSLSTGDYSCLDQILPQLMDEFASSFVSVAMPSMRVGTLTEKVMDQIKRVRKTGFTMAPEAGSERLRRVINKGITEADLLQTCEQAFSLGWKNMKLYFMIGLPTETDEDIDAIGKLASETRYHGAKSGHGKRQIKVSVGTFVPKPHTPFQWHKQLTMEESKTKIFRIKDSLTKGCTLSYHSPQQSFLEGVFSRGDRRLSALIEKAWRMGARLDGWSDHFNLARWQQAAEECGIDMDFYLRERDFDEVLPWNHLQTGVDEAFLRSELDKAMGEIYTPDCRYHDCQQCGLCDFDEIRPIVWSQEDDAAAEYTPSSAATIESTTEPAHIKYLVDYQRTGNICFLGHLEILQLMFRALKRANITTNFSQGFNPSPKISFGPALPVGTESLAEYFIMDLPTTLSSIEKTTKLINDKLPPGLKINTITLHSGKIDQNTLNSYQITFPEELTSAQKKQLAEFEQSEEFIIERLRKGKVKQLNIRPMIQALAVTDADKIAMDIINKASFPGIKPQEAIQHILSLSEQEVLETKVLKTGWIPLKE